MSEENEQLCFLMIFCEAEFARRVVDLLDDMQVPGFSIIEDVRGLGRSGRREDSEIWPGRNTLIFLALDCDERAEEIVQGAEQIIRQNYRKRPGFRVFRMHGDALD